MNGDTVLIAPEIIGRLNLLSFTSQNIDIRKVVLNNADIRFAIDPKSDEINIKFIIDKITKNDTIQNKQKWIFGIRSLELSDCRFLFRNEMKTYDKPFGMDYAEIDVSNIYLVASDFKPAGDSIGGVGFRIRRLSGIEKCGLVLKFMSADFFVNTNNLSFKNVHLNTEFSEIIAKDISFNFDSFKDFPDFVTKVKMSVDIQSSEVAFCCLSQFANYFGRYSGKATLSGRVTGTVEDMKGYGIDVHFGEMTRINGNFDLKGLPDIRTTLIYADIAELTTCPKDIELIKVLRLPDGHISIPATMHKLSIISFKGNFTGFFDDFVTYGDFTTNLGKLSTDVSIKPSTGNALNDTTFTFYGTLKTQRFHLGELLTQPAIGEIDMSGKIDGAVSVRGNVFAKLTGNIESIGLKGYEYHDIDVRGAINNRIYNGHLSIDEPNIKLDFSGKVDITETIPAFDFSANVERARLHNLKLVNNDTSSFVAFNIDAVFSGNNIDNLSGELDLKNSLIRRNNREIEINNLLIFTKTIRDTNQFILRSDIFDAEIRGQYEFLKLPESFYSMVKNFAPAWVPTSVNPDSLSHNNFRFEARFKDTRNLTDFFVNGFSVARGSYIEGVYNPLHRNLNFIMSVPFMRLGGMSWQGFYVNCEVDNSTFAVESGCSAFNVNKNMKFDNPTVLAQAQGDSLDLNIRWNNWDSPLYKGNISSKLFFTQKQNTKIPIIEIFSTPGQIVFADDEWKLTHKGIVVDSTSIKVDSLSALMGNQKISVSGVVSQREQDNLKIDISDLDLSVFNSSLQFDKLLFGGIATGTASLSNLYGVPVFVSDIHIDDFALNNSLFGSTNIVALWNNVNRSVGIEAVSLLNDWRTMSINGNYFIANRMLDFDVSLVQIPVTILQPYLRNIFNEMEGMFSGDIKLTGVINEPVMNGAIGMHEAALMLDYTKTKYNFEGLAQVKNNSIILKGIEMFDRYKNSCKITDGYILIERFKDISFDLSLQANNIEALNTRERDNNLFYGSAFATGNIRIKGNPRYTQLNIIGKTEKNTQFNIPLSSSDNVTKSSFITFINNTPRPQRRLIDIRRQNELARIDEQVIEEARLDINIEMEVTPDAEARLIFDPKVGDIINARGSGNLDLTITADRFDMIGTYTIEEGNYLFTLQDITSKFFSIEKGGIITFSGDPLDALLDLKAIYTTRASLKSLMTNDDDLNRTSSTVPVECILHISNKITNPNIRFELEMPPNTNQEIRSMLSAATNSEEEMRQQFLWLLVFNRFYTDPSQSTNSTSSTGLEMGLASVSEFFSNQMSYMLSQWNENVDIDISVRPGLYSTEQIYEGGLSTKNWNLHANYVTTENSENVGEFSFDIKVLKSNRLRFKAFNRANATYLPQNQYTQGIGFLFREDFNKTRDLFKRKKSSAIRREDELEDIDNNEINTQNSNKNTTTAAAGDNKF